MNHMTTCPRTSRMQATSHIPRLIEVKRASSSPALLPLRPLAATSFGELGGELLVNGQGPLRVGHVILEALHLNCEVTLPGQFCLDRCCQSGHFLLPRCNESRMIGLAVLFLLLGGHQLLQNVNDLAALCTARQERKQSGTIIIGESNTCGYLQRGSWLLLPFTRACFLTTLTFRALHGNHIVSTPFQTIVEDDKHKKSSPTCPSTS